MISPVFPLTSRKRRLAACDSGGGGGFIGITGNATAGTPTIAAVPSTAAVVVGAKGMSGGAAFTSVTVLSKTVNTVTFTGNLPATEGVLVVLQDAAPPLSIDGLHVKLFKNSPSLSPNTVLADFVESDFDGYAAIVLALTFGYVNPSGLPISQSQLLSWVMTGIVTPNTVHGYWIDDGTDVLMAANFDAPIGMAGVGAEIAGVLQDSYPTGQGFVQVTP
jgi:hypothetical protein